jgi:23S rRNA G2069 N7-methylase RlmK/C1962 C5-methylase RlmI
MADSSGLRAGQFIIRSRPPWQRRMLMVGGLISAVLLLYAVYEAGRFQGGYSKLAEIQHRHEMTAQIDALNDANDKLKAELASEELARNVDKEAYSQVEKNLAELQAQVLKHREELTFYRGIVAPEDGVGGLRIQRFQILPAGAEHHCRKLVAKPARTDRSTSSSGTFRSSSRT